MSISDRKLVQFIHKEESMRCIICGVASHSFTCPLALLSLIREWDPQWECPACRDCAVSLNRDNLPECRSCRALFTVLVPHMGGGANSERIEKFFHMLGPERQQLNVYLMKRKGSGRFPWDRVAKSLRSVLRQRIRKAWKTKPKRRSRA
jgi:hypothetical protein